MSNNVFGINSSPYDIGNSIDTSLVVQKPYLRSNYTEANTEEDIDLKNEFGIKNVTDPKSIREAASKNHFDSKFNDPSTIKSNNPHPDIDLNYKNIINVGLTEVNHWPEYGDQLTSNFYSDKTIRNTVDQSSLLRLDPDEKLNLDEQDSIPLTSSLLSRKTKIELPTKSFVDKNSDVPSIMKKHYSC